MAAPDHPEIEKQIQYVFNNKELLREALRHSSFVNEQPAAGLRDNERLEFLGDAVLNLVVGHLLMQHYPALKEGDLSRMRAGLVNELQLAAIARSLDLGAYLCLGKGERQTRGREKNSILADSFEALTAAIYLDGGFQAAFGFIETRFVPILESVYPAAGSLDYKSRLQQWVQERQSGVPKYSIFKTTGPDHDKTFWVSLKVLGTATVGCGKSKKTAEQDAARKALEILAINEPDRKP